MKRLFTLALLLCSFSVTAQTYPSRTVRIVVPATPGGATDLIARTLAEKMGGTPEQFAYVIRTEVEKWGRVTKAAGIQPE